MISKKFVNMALSRTRNVVLGVGEEEIADQLGITYAKGKIMEAVKVNDFVKAAFWSAYAEAIMIRSDVKREASIQDKRGRVKPNGNT